MLIFSCAARETGQNQNQNSSPLCRSNIYVSLWIGIDLFVACGQVTELGDLNPISGLVRTRLQLESK